jgi:hypothetical protein
MYYVMNWLIACETIQSIYWRKVVCFDLFCFVLFCYYEIHWTKMLQILFMMFLEISQWKGVHGLNSMMFGLVVQKFLNIEWLFPWKLCEDFKYEYEW